MRYLDLFTGIAGISRCMQACSNVKCAAYVEIHPPAQRVILSHISDRTLQEAPVLSDVCIVKAKDVGPVNMICGGFPCQDISAAGAQRGLQGTRSRLVFEMIRLLRETGAKWFFAENVAHFRTNGFEQVKEELEKLGYAVRHVVLAANECGMRHRRRRMFVLARKKNSSADALSAKTPNAMKITREEPSSRIVSSKEHNWFDRIHGLGNACSPVQCNTALRMLLGNPEPGTDWDTAWNTDRIVSIPAGPVCPVSCPTPIASDAKGGAGPNRRNSRGMCTSFSLSRWVRVRHRRAEWGLSCTEEEYANRRVRGAYLCPEWTEWLMGFPEKWTHVQTD